MTELTFGRLIVSCTLRSVSLLSSGLDSEGLWLFGFPGLPGLFDLFDSMTLSSACSFPGNRTINVLWVSLSLKPGWLCTGTGLSLTVFSGLIFWWLSWWFPGLFVPCGLLSTHVLDDTAGVCCLLTSCSDVGLACGLFCKGLAPCENGFIGLVELPVELWDSENW